MKSQKTPPKTGASRKSIHPAIMVGMVLLILTAVFLLVSRFMLDSRDTNAERTGEQRGGEQMPSDAERFRADGILTFEKTGGDKTGGLTIEIAEDDEARTQGLMGRQSMAENQGMLFIFPEEDWRSFWMVNTILSLDILFINARREIITIHRDTVPFSESSIPSTAPAMYVLEVNAGYCSRYGIGVGDRISWLRH